jgi:hypothetical protein
MATPQQVTVPTHLYGVAAFQMLTALMADLEKKGVISNQERAMLFNNASAGLSPPNDPGVQAMKQLLWQLSATVQGS